VTAVTRLIHDTSSQVVCGNFALVWRKQQSDENNVSKLGGARCVHVKSHIILLFQLFVYFKLQFDVAVLLHSFAKNILK